jgi:hypothetical protein
MAKPFEELALISVPFLCQADPPSAARIETMARAAAECLTEFGLATSSLVDRFKANPDQFVILLGDLTPEGLAFARTGFQRWLANTDRWTGDKAPEKYKRALVKQWEKTRGRAV